MINFYVVFMYVLCIVVHNWYFFSTIDFLFNIFFFSTIDFLFSNW